ncbi:hypothetical protein FRB96_007560 [Tulasnella sp. 330]|nr:hypothetical protein FRB96_007560 [Tulasnella sp. 330]KAG8882018.1 hypothetical protein FRB97_008792 [Tulasnella sp. 331]KAG8887981.1 hypothetical protein FRB98_008654 [Tulasnella sp. 332]
MVSKYWLDVIKSMPSLWGVAAYSSYTKLPQTIIALSRSKDAPLKIFSGSPPLKTNPQNNFLGFLHAISPHTHRWASLCMSDGGITGLPKTIAARRTLVLPNPFELGIPTLHNWTEDQFIKVTINSLDQLRELRLTRVVPVVSAGWVAERLKVLTLIDIDHTRLLPEDLMELLASCPSLEELELGSYLTRWGPIPPTTPSMPSITFPYLRTLRLEGLDPVYLVPLATILIAEAVETAHLMLPFGPDEARQVEILSPDEAGMALLLQDCMFALSESSYAHFVIVHDGPGPGEKVFRSVPWLSELQDERLSQLETLVLDAAEEITKEILVYLSQPQAHYGSLRREWPCPRLNRLVIRTEDFKGEAGLSGLIASRRVAVHGAPDALVGDSDVKAPCALLDISFPYWEPEQAMAVALRIARASGCRFYRYPRGYSEGIGFKLLPPDEAEENIRTMRDKGFREILLF